MKRRTFLKSLLGVTVLGGGVWATLDNKAFFKMLASDMLSGPKSVSNRQPVPAFTTESFAGVPSVRFLVLGDWGTGGKLQRRVAAAMAELARREQPQFIMSTGDNIYPDGVESADDPQWKSKFTAIYSDPALSIPWYAVLGNHDYRSNPDAQVDYSAKNPLWRMPARYFTFSQEIDKDHGADFFALDTQPLMSGRNSRTSAQLDWLEAALSASQARWKVVFGHHMIRSHGIYGDQKPMLRLIKPLLDKYEVDLYVNGHDHDLQYLKAADDVFRCLISGGGGGARNTAYGKNTIFAATNGGFAYVALTKDKLYVEFLDDEGTALFADTVEKVS